MTKNETGALIAALIAGLAGVAEMIFSRKEFEQQKNELNSVVDRIQKPEVVFLNREERRRAEQQARRRKSR